ncbi:hypothetical protein GCM10010274_11570 [Streptomyces lavendofoliae]|uniref:Uncharacterized protein n=2 Tax=Streptomyces lavendofoliae TaxID=67314 RepID=A0A918HTQ7_9ACTN|nr:hypothetical protein GCM10010274_11570 [Streptomyces lavendofoliae]
MSDSGTRFGMGEERGARAAYAHALAVLRVRGRALAVALLPAAFAVVLLTGAATGHLPGAGWDAARWSVSVVAAVALVAGAAVATVIVRARPALTPTVEIPEASAPDLYRMVRDLAGRLDVPVPSGIALTPDCDSWLEDRTHPAHGRPAVPGLHRSDTPPVLVIGSPFLWWMRVAELRAVLAPVVAGTGPSAHPDIAAARRFVRGLDAAVAVADRPGLDPVRRLGARFVGAVARVLLRGCRGHAAEMERGVAAAASERAQAVDYGLRIVAQEQVGLAYAGWDRLLTRVALPAWRMGRWPSRLDAGVVSALTELSRRDRLAEGFTSRLGERPACDLLEEPGLVDEATSLLAARLFHGGPAEMGPDWAPVDWQQYPDEVVDRKWRTEAARLHRVLDRLGVDQDAEATLARVMDHLSTTPTGETLAAAITAEVSREAAAGAPLPGAEPGTPAAPASAAGPDGPARAPDPRPGEAPRDPRPSQDPAGPRTAPAPENPGLPAPDLPAPDPAPAPEDPDLPAPDPAPAPENPDLPAPDLPSAPPPISVPGDIDHAAWGPGGDALPLFPLQPPRSGRELLADHVTAMVCCAAVDTAGAEPGLDWLDGPTLLVGGKRHPDLAARILSLIEDADPEPLRSWLTTVGVRPEKPVRLV